MTKRNIILISILAFSYLGMAAYLSYQYPDQSNALLQITFGIVLVGAAIVGIKLSRGKSKGKGVLRILKVLFASYAFAFAIWMLGSVLLLPAIGYGGFNLVGTPTFIYVLLGLSLLASPLVAKRLA